MLYAGERPLKEMAASFSLPDLASRFEIGGGTITLVGWVKATMQEMLEVIGELEKGCICQPDALSDRSQMDAWMSHCYDMFDLGCAQGVAQVKSMGGELPESMVVDGHSLLGQSRSPSPPQSALHLTSMTATSISDPLWVTDLLNERAAPSPLADCLVREAQLLLSHSPVESHIISSTRSTTKELSTPTWILESAVNGEHHQRGCLKLKFSVQQSWTMGIKKTSDGSGEIFNPQTMWPAPTGMEKEKTSGVSGEPCNSQTLTPALLWASRRRLVELKPALMGIKKTSGGTGVLFNSQTMTPDASSYGQREDIRGNWGAF
ncbi:hypothetical protein CBR_g26229 [Chara braunii]|uniref:Uncharacterized protein n=1 Tax=Chara braunii TaxID=69332 RepID=A0A388L7C3_CHABU|nr:hypothetical protein CBR_g26229 [Chara braunii]|eukprot:GBG78196.1 hypothetical protein CBR_g26229 [Chara braunii]